MKKISCILSMLVVFMFNTNAQNNSRIQSLAGPRLGVVYVSPSIGSGFLNGTLELFGDLPNQSDYDDIVKGAFTSLYGWQFESRFSDGGNITGIVEWIVLAGGMERGKFLPSVSSMVGARNINGFEFALGPNLSLAGIGMVFGMGYNFKSGQLNIPVNIALVPGRKGTRTVDVPANAGPDKDWDTDDDVPYSQETLNLHTGHRVSITVGFNLAR